MAGFVDQITRTEYVNSKFKVSPIPEILMGV